jgi:predicted metal-dependent hydrolase
MQVHVEETKKLRRASASIRDGGIIHVKVPRHWPRDSKRSAIDELVARLQRKDAQEKALLSKASPQARVTITTQPELERYVRQINTETFNAPLGKVQLGYARYNHLAQVNLRTKTMTVSKFCLQNAPAEALRYLIIHELAHYYESGHGAKFWALVGQHVPDYRLQSRIMKAFHHQAVIEDDTKQAIADLHAAETSGQTGSAENLLPPKKSPYATKPDTLPGAALKKTTSGKGHQGKKASPDTSAPKVPPFSKIPPIHDKTGFLPGFVKQLQLWINR